MALSVESKQGIRKSDGLEEKNHYNNPKIVLHSDLD